nr:reverse transcriptase domain-containing protein [Tanacetum cinerariifolium]
MSSLFADTHNVVAMLEKSDAAEGFEQIIDFLSGSYIHYDLTASPHIYISCIKQFWNSVQWKFLIHTILQSLSVKRTSWNEFSTAVASAVICLSKGQRFNFSKYIFDSLVRNLDSSSKFYMYPRFIQLIIQAQVGDFSTHTTRFISLALTQKVFANMRRVGKGFSGVKTPLFIGMIADRQPVEEELGAEQVQVDAVVAAAVVEDVVEDVAEDVAYVATPSPPPHGIPAPPQEPSSPPQQPYVKPPAPTQELEIVNLKARVKKLEQTDKVKSSKLRRLRKVGASRQVESSNDIEDVFNQGRMMNEDEGSGKRQLEKKSQIRLWLKAAKRRKLSEEAQEAEDLRKRLEVVEDEDDDEATHLASKVPVVDYQIVLIDNKPRYKIIRADDTHQLYISFTTLLKNFDREDLETLWRILKDRFSTSKPSNSSDEYLLLTLRIMFEEPDGQAAIWRNQKSVHDLLQNSPVIKLPIQLHPHPTPKGRICRSSKQEVENTHFEEHLTPVATVTDNRTLAEMLRAPTERCAEAIIVPSILAEQFKLKHSLFNMMTLKQLFGLKKDNPHDHVRWFNKITSTIKYKDVPNSVIKLVLFPFSVAGAARRKSPQDALTIIENKSKVRISRSKPIASPVNACDNHSSFELAKLTHAVNQQTSAVTTAMTAMLKQFQSNPPPVQVKAVEEICVTYGGAHPYYQCLAADGNTFPEFQENIQGYVLAAVGNYNQGNTGYRPQGVANQMRIPEQPYQATQSNQNFHLNELEKIKRMNDISLKAMQTQIDMVKNELRNEMKTSIQTSLSNQTNEIKNMMASLLQMNTASTSGSGTLPSNTIANPKGEIKAITTRSGLVTDGPTFPNPPKSVNPKEDKCVEETYTDPDHAEYTIKVPPPPSVSCQNTKKMLKALLSNKEKLQELANTPLNENFSAVILKKLPEKLGDPGKFLIPCGFSELKCKALADLGASINLIPLFVWKKLGLPDLILIRMTLELANRAICTPDGIARDVFVPVGKFTFLVDFVVVDYESDFRVPLILGRQFLRTAHALIDVHDEEMILCDGDERLTLNMKHDTTSYSNHPHRELVNLINIFNLSSEDCLEVLGSHKQSGNPTFLLHKEIALPEVIHEFHDSKGCTFLSEELPDIDSFNDIHPHFDDDPLSGSTTFSANSLLEEFADELALISYPPDYDDNSACDIESDIREIKFLLSQGKDSDFKDSIDQSDLTHYDDLFVDPTPEMFTDEQPPDYSFPPRFDVYPDD